MKTDRKIVTYAELEGIRERAHKHDKKIVFTTGCYDLLHMGHLIHLEYAKGKGDILVVSVGNDKTVKSLKGPHRPINSQDLRARLLAAMEVVDYVVISEEHGKMDHDILVAQLRPHFFAVPGNDSAVDAKRALVEKHGGKLAPTKRVPPKGAKGISTTEIEKRLE